MSFRYPASDAVIENPYTGNVVWASHPDAYNQPFSMVYANIYWKDFEPEPGQYAFDALEKYFQFDHWRQEGKHVVIRFIMDSPSDTAHRDIPDWLYLITGDGTDYDTAYGKGYSPNYDNVALISAHRRAIAALGERYGNDPFVAFVQLGSLGHWGEWHVNPEIGQMPKEEVREAYVAPYLQYFEAEQLLMRRPFSIAAEEGMGLYNDMAGHGEATQIWLDWIEHGGVYDQTGEKAALAAMPDAWKSAPIGGELSSAIDMADVLGIDLLKTIELLSTSHASWIGPNSLVNIDKDGPQQKALDQIMKTIGYRLRVDCMTVTRTLLGGVNLEIDFVNDGVAPFYFDWPVVLRVQSNLHVTQIPLVIDLRTVLPGETVTETIHFAKADLPEGMSTLSVAVLDPQTGKPGLALAMGTNPQKEFVGLGSIEFIE